MASRLNVKELDELDELEEPLTDEDKYDARTFDWIARRSRGMNGYVPLKVWEDYADRNNLPDAFDFVCLMCAIDDELAILHDRHKPSTSTD